MLSGANSAPHLGTLHRCKGLGFSSIGVLPVHKWWDPIVLQKGWQPLNIDAFHFKVQVNIKGLAGSGSIYLSTYRDSVSYNLC